MFEIMRVLRGPGTAPTLAWIGAALLLAGCGGGVEGEYFLKMGEARGEGVTLVLERGGKAAVTIPGLGSVRGTYTVDGDRVTVVMQDGDVDTYTLEGGNLTSTEMGEKLVLVKQ